MLNSKMSTLLIISLLMAVAYIAAVIIKDKKLPDSISALVYALPSKWQWVWTLWLWAVNLLMCIPLIDVLPEIWKFLGFLTLACLGFVGAMPLINEDSKNMHWIFGISGCILSQICVWFIDYESLWIWIIFPILFLNNYIFPNNYITRVTKEKSVFIAELLCYISLIVAYCKY